METAQQEKQTQDAPKTFSFGDQYKTPNTIGNDVVYIYPEFDSKGLYVLDFGILSGKVTERKFKRPNKPEEHFVKLGLELKERTVDSKPQEIIIPISVYDGLLGIKELYGEDAKGAYIKKVGTGMTTKYEVNPRMR